MRRWIVCAALLMLVRIAVAGDEVGHWYIDPQVGAIITDHRRDTDNQVIFGGSLGYNISKYFSAELNMNETKLGDHFDPGSTRLHALSVDFLGILNRGNTF